MSISVLLARHAAELGPLSADQIARLAAHWELVLKWNQKINLTRVLSPEVALWRHYGESLFLARHLHGSRAIDVGSGGGFPGIPAAILRPELGFVLAESTRKKAVFLREASRDLPNVEVIWKRAQAIEGRYDFAIARAVDPEEVLQLKLSSGVALLVSRSDAERLRGPGTIYPLPWDQDRAVLVRSRTVPRETPC